MLSRFWTLNIIIIHSTASVPTYIDQSFNLIRIHRHSCMYFQIVAYGSFILFSMGCAEGFADAYSTFRMDFPGQPSDLQAAHDRPSRSEPRRRAFIHHMPLLECKVFQQYVFGTGPVSQREFQAISNRNSPSVLETFRPHVESAEQCRQLLILAIGARPSYFSSIAELQLSSYSPTPSHVVSL